MTVRWDPFRDFLSIQRDMNRLFSDTMSSREAAPVSRSETWAPPVDVHESAAGFTIAVELPGVKKEDIQLELKDESLTLRGERKAERDVKEGVHRIERVYGPFHRSFNLPSSIDTSAVKASFRDGVLEITLPKAEEAKPRQISIAA
jgi:HSP20 family protein